MTFLTRLAAGLVAGAVGFFGGLFALLSATGLDHPGWAPVAMLTGAALLGSATVAYMAKLRAAVAIGITAATTAAGAAIGNALRQIGDSYEWVVATGVAMIVLAAFATRAMGPSRTA